MTDPDLVMILEVDAGRAATIAAPLTEAGFKTRVCHTPLEAAEALRASPPVLIVFDPDSGPGLGFEPTVAAARGQGIPVLGLVDAEEEPARLLERVRGFDAWLDRRSVGRELAARALGLVARSAAPPSPAIDPRFLALVIHDLRTPLNVIGLTIRAISQSAPQPTAEFEEDLSFLQENARQIERMLAQLGDYCRLIEGESRVSGSEFDPRRFLADFLDERQGRPGADPAPVRLELAEDGPREVSLDATRARLALQHALANASAAAGEAPVRLRLTGGPGRWVVELVVEKPPPATVSSMALRPDKFERLAGVAAERRGLDLAIAARVSELFGGSARLEVEAGRRTTVVLDWPDRLASR